MGVPHQGKGADHSGGGHRGAAVITVLVARQRAVDVRSRGGDLDGRPAEIAEIREAIRPGGGGDGHHVVGVVAGRVNRARIDVGSIVPGRGDEDHPLGPGGGNGRAHRRVGPAAGVTVVHDLGAVGDRKVQRLDGIAEVAAAALVEELQGHELDVPVHPGDADAVVADRPDDAGDVGAVAVVVHHIGVVVHEVPASNGRILRTRPDVGLQVRMIVIDPAVDDGDDHLSRPGVRVPGFGRVDIRVRGAPALAGVVQPPNVGQAGIIRETLDLNLVIGLGKLDGRLVFEIRDGLVYRHVLRQGELILTVADRLRLAHQRTRMIQAVPPLHQNAVLGVMGGVDLDGRSGRLLPAFQTLQPEARRVAFSHGHG